MKNGPEHLFRLVPEVEAICAANVLLLQCLRGLSGVCTRSSWYTARDLNPEPAD